MLSYPFSINPGGGSQRGLEIEEYIVQQDGNYTAAQLETNVGGITADQMIDIMKGKYSTVTGHYDADSPVVYNVTEHSYESPNGTAKIIRSPETEVYWLVETEDDGENFAVDFHTNMY